MAETIVAVKHQESRPLPAVAIATKRREVQKNQIRRKAQSMLAAHQGSRRRV